VLNTPVVMTVLKVVIPPPGSVLDQYFVVRYVKVETSSEARGNSSDVLEGREKTIVKLGEKDGVVMAEEEEFVAVGVEGKRGDAGAISDVVSDGPVTVGSKVLHKIV
jgi:hypothetical protein